MSRVSNTAVALRPLEAASDIASPVSPRLTRAQIVAPMGPSKREAKLAMADAFNATSVSAVQGQRSLAGHAWLRDFVRDRAAFLGNVEQPGMAATAVLIAAGRERNAPRDLTALAQTYDNATMRRVVERIVRDNVRTRDVDAVVDGILEGLGGVVVNVTAREPMHEALVEILNQRNTTLEATVQGDTAREHPEAVAELQANDRLIHALSTSLYEHRLGGTDVYAVVPELTRVALATERVGLAPSDYPFTGVSAKTFAQSAVLNELRGRPPMRDDDMALLSSAAGETKRAARDLLRVLPYEVRR